MAASGYAMLSGHVGCGGPSVLVCMFLPDKVMAVHSSSVSIVGQRQVACIDEACLLCVNLPFVCARMKLGLNACI